MSALAAGARWGAWLAVLLGVAGAMPASPRACAVAPAGVVDARQYDAFWLWAGVKPQPVLAEARTLYLLQAQIHDDHRGGVRFDAQRGALPRASHAELWLVYRVHTLRWTPRIHALLLSQLARARQGGARVVGVQLDFDARSRHLDDYAAFLRELRTRLPADCRLSITGLMDWSQHADPATLNTLRTVLDEIVVQTYQGRHTITNYAAYLPRVSRLTVPFKIGLIQGGQWQAPDYLAASPWFRGYVVFLQNPGVIRRRQNRAGATPQTPPPPPRSTD